MLKVIILILHVSIVKKIRLKIKVVKIGKEEEMMKV
jgi:hypothetical protein